MKVELVTFRNRPANEPIRDGLLIIMAVPEARAWHIVSTQKSPSVHCLAIHMATDDEVRGLEQSTSVYPNARLVTARSVLRQLEEFEADPADMHVTVDVSCMPRTVMAELFAKLFEIAGRRELKITVFYSLASYTPPPEHLPPNEAIRPVHPAFAGWPKDVSASTAIIVGLGYEKDKAEGACEYFDPSETWVFTPRSPISAYDVDVSNNNASFIERAERDRKIEYRVDDPERTFAELVSVSMSILPRATPLILPFGPKIFFATSLFVSLLYEDIGVWLITGDLDVPQSNHTPSGTNIAFETKLRPENVMHDVA